jgi:hypothetical protein
MDAKSTPPVEYGVTPADIMASMPGVEFVRAIFSGKLRRRRSCKPSSRSTPPPSPASW